MLVDFVVVVVFIVAVVVICSRVLFTFIQSEEVVVPRLALLGDTTVDVFTSVSADAILACAVVIVECTLLGLAEGEAALARERGHVCWTELRPIIAANPSVHFVLTHFSMVSATTTRVDVVVYCAVSSCSHGTTGGGTHIVVPLGMFGRMHCWKYGGLTFSSHMTRLLRWLVLLPCVHVAA